MFCLGVALFMSTLAVFFTDVVDMYQLLLQAWFFLTPIIYPRQMFPAHYGWLMQLNPMYPLIELFRRPIYAGQLPAMHMIARRRSPGRLRRWSSVRGCSRARPMSSPTAEPMLPPSPGETSRAVIRLENVSVRYRLPRERITSVKDYAIRLLKRQIRLRRVLGAARRVARGAAGRDARHHRPQRRGQEHAAEDWSPGSCGRRTGG